MTASFPTSLKTFTRPGSSTKQDDSGVELDTVINAIHDEVEALETNVGVTSSAVTSTINYKLTNTSSSDPGHKHTLANGATDVTATPTELNYVGGVTSAIQTQLNAKATGTIPVKATGAETNTGTDDAKFVTPKAIADSNLLTTTKQRTVTSYTPAGGATATLNLTTGNIHAITMPAGNITIAISNEAVGQCFLIEITQDSVGSRTVTWFATIRWAGGVAPTLTTTGNKRDTFGFIVTSAGNYDGFVVGQNL